MQGHALDANEICRCYLQVPELQVTQLDCLAFPGDTTTIHNHYILCRNSKSPPLLAIPSPPSPSPPPPQLFVQWASSATASSQYGSGT
eukprot:5153888-Prymnesium_polylepis.1